MAQTASTREKNLAQFGFSFGRGGAHLARSMMLKDLTLLLEVVGHPNATLEDYQQAILDQNCLGKRSLRTRQLTLGHLKDLYLLDSRVAIFRALKFFWQRDPEARGLLALLVAYSRDAILRSSAPFVLQLELGETVMRPNFEEILDQQEEGRFSKATLMSTAQNLGTTWAHAGYFKGSARKIRSEAITSPGSVALALFLSYLSGARGQMLFETEYMRLLDCSTDRAIELAESASRRGWIVFKRVGNVIEVQFPALLTKQEQEWVHEQS
jgi:hypothetical protein